jgi:two-component system, NtrC family, sensor histidine kinase HydH
MGDLRDRTTLFCGIIAFAIALSVLLRGRRPVHLLFAAFATCVAAWYASQSLAGLLHSTLWARVTTVLTVLLPQFALRVFEATIEGPRTTRFTRIATAAGLPMLVLALSPYHEVPLSLAVLYSYVIAFFVSALYMLHRRGQASSSRAIRDRVRFLVVVGALATTFTLADFVSFRGVNLPPIGAVLAIVFVFVLAESLQRVRMADLYELSGRLLVSTTLAFALAGIFYGFITYIGRFGAMYLNAVLAAIVFLVLFDPLRGEIERRIHQFFFRERRDLETSIVDLRRRLAHTIEMNDLGPVLMAGLERSRRITSAAMYIRDPDGFDLARSIGSDAPPRLEALAIRPLLEQLGNSMPLEERLRSSADADAPLETAAATLGPHRNSVILAVRGDDDELVGLLCVIDERVRDAFTPEEVTLFETLAAQIGVAITNTRVYAKLKERDRLAALGAMAAGLAHEVKNPLGAIKGAAQLLEESVPASDDTSREFLGIIIEETNRLNRVVGSFLDYARPHQGNPVPLDVNAALRRTIQILVGAKETPELELRLELAERLPFATIDAEHFRQVVINLVQNAIQAVSERGTVRITTSLRATSRRFTTDGRDPGDEYIEVSVHDTGHGMGPKVLQNLFVPFFTTKDQGTGLGLAITQRIVQNAGGRVEVQSVPGSGTTFTLVLPAAREKMLSQSPPDSNPQAVPRSVRDVASLG